MPTKSRSKRSLAVADDSNVRRLECRTCHFKWTAHDHVKKCPRCESTSICYEDLDEAKPRGRAWKCSECEEIYWQEGFASVCGNEECASKDIFPLENARQCTACYEWYESTELGCPDCGNREFSPEPIFPPDGLDEAFDGEAQANGHAEAAAKPKSSRVAHTATLPPQEPGTNGPTRFKELTGWPSGRVHWECPACGAKGPDGEPAPEKCPKCRWAEPGTRSRSTETKPSVSEPVASVSESSAPKSETPAGGIMLIRVSEIVPSPTNPRQNFDPEKLAALADSLKSVGLLEPVLVRPVNMLIGKGTAEEELVNIGLLKGRTEKKWMIIAGERRWRAAKLAKLAELPCRVLDVTEEEAAEAQIRENLDRDDLNPIERARSYQLALDKCGWTQEVLAKKFGISQETISRTLGLLTLQEPWRTWLIQRRITTMHAQAVVRWQDVPGLSEQLLKDFPELKDGDVDELPRAGEFTSQVLSCVRSNSRGVGQGGYGRDQCHFRPTKDQLAQLDVRKVPKWDGRGGEPRAFNIKLWEELNRAAKQRAREREAKGADGKKKPKPARDNFEARHKRWQQEVKRDRFGKAMLLEKSNALGPLIAAKLDRQKHGLMIRRCALVLSTCGDWAGGTLCDTLGFRNWGQDAKIVAKVIGLTQGQLETVLFDAVHRALAEEQEHHHDVPLSLLEWLARVLKVDFSAGWNPHLAFFAHYEDAGYTDRLVKQLPAHARERLGEKVTPKDLLIAWPAGFVPHELLAVDENGKIPSAKKPAAKKGAKVRS